MKESQVKLLEREGPVLSGRMQAKSLISELTADITSGKHVTLDFEGILALSPSFADELFVRFARDVSTEQVSFTNLSDELQRIAAAVRR